MRHAERVVQPVGEHLAHRHRAVRGDLLDDVVDAGGHHRGVEVAERAGLVLALQQVQRLRRVQPRARDQHPQHLGLEPGGQLGCQRRQGETLGHQPAWRPGAANASDHRRALGGADRPSAQRPELAAARACANAPAGRRPARRWSTRPTHRLGHAHARHAIRSAASADGPCTRWRRSAAPRRAARVARSADTHRHPPSPPNRFTATRPSQ